MRRLAAKTKKPGRRMFSAVLAFLFARPRPAGKNRAAASPYLPKSGRHFMPPALFSRFLGMGFFF